MAVIDASSPAIFSGSVSNGVAITSVSFTAPSNSLLVCQVVGDTNQTSITVSVADSGGLTWTPKVENNGNEAPTGPYVATFTALQQTSAARTVSVTRSVGALNPARLWAKVWVVTGADILGTPFDAIGAGNKGGTTSNSFNTTSITPGADGILFVVNGDWTGAGVGTSSDLTIQTATVTGVMDIIFGWKAVTNGVAATANIDAVGSGAAMHKWSQIIARSGLPSATWKASQDTNVTLPAGSAARLRMLINATNDPVSNQYQLEYRKVGDSTWKKVT